jgi:regulator of sigma E protease
MQKHVGMRMQLLRESMMNFETPNIFLTLLAFVVLIGTLVVVHELGHYWVGRWFGVKAEKFSIGFGPQLWGRIDKRGTLWRIGALPLGGYVQFAGDMNPAGQPDENWYKMSDEERNQTFQSKALWKRALIVFAGPAINFIFAILILMGFLLHYGMPNTPAIVDSVKENSPAAAAQIQIGDRIKSLNGYEIDGFAELSNEVMIIPNEKITLEIERNGKLITKSLTTGIREEVDRFGNKYKLGVIGVGSVETVIKDVGLIEAPYLAVKQTVAVLRMQIKGIAQIISGRRSVKELGGPIKIAKLSGEAMTAGASAFIFLAAMISINLGFMNLLPIPMLDGGHLMLYGIEAVRKRPATPKVQEWAFKLGFVMLVSFMLMVTFNDVSSFAIFGGGS